MRLETRRQETGADAGEFLVGRDFSPDPLKGGSRAFGWSGFGALLLIAPLVSLGYIWFNLKVHSPRTLRNRVQRAKHRRRGCADLDADCNPIQT